MKRSTLMMAALGLGGCAAGMDSTGVSGRGRPCERDLLEVGDLYGCDEAAWLAGQDEQALPAPVEIGAGADWVASDGAYLYWLVEGETILVDGYPSWTGELRRVLLAGGASAIVATELGTPRKLAIESGRAYWIAEYDDSAAFDVLFTLALDSPTPESLFQTGGQLAVKDDVAYLAADGGFWAVDAEPPAELIAGGEKDATSLATDGEFLYWTRSAVPTDVVLQLPVGGAIDATLLAQFESQPHDLQVDATHVYWLDGKNNLRRASKRGGEATTVLNEPEDAPRGYALDGAYVYWTAGETVKRMPKAGGAAEFVAAGQEAPERILIAGDSVVWTDGGRIMTVRKQ